MRPIVIMFLAAGMLALAPELAGAQGAGGAGGSTGGSAGAGAGGGTSAGAGAGVATQPSAPRPSPQTNPGVSPNTSPPSASVPSSPAPARPRSAVRGGGGSPRHARNGRNENERSQDQATQELDKALDRKLNICKGC
jgi:hypothetical protein